MPCTWHRQRDARFSLNLHPEVLVHIESPEVVEVRAAARAHTTTEDEHLPPEEARRVAAAPREGGAARLCFQPQQAIQVKDPDIAEGFAGGQVLPHTTAHKDAAAVDEQRRVGLTRLRISGLLHRLLPRPRAGGLRVQRGARHHRPWGLTNTTQHDDLALWLAIAGGARCCCRHEGRAVEADPSARWAVGPALPGHRVRVQQVHVTQRSLVAVRAHAADHHHAAAGDRRGSVAVPHLRAHRRHAAAIRLNGGGGGPAKRRCRGVAVEVRRRSTSRRYGCGRPTVRCRAEPQPQAQAPHPALTNQVTRR